MAASQSRKRAFWAGSLVVLSAVMAATAFQVSRPPPELAARNGGALAAPGLSTPAAKPRKIKVVAARGGYTLARTLRDGWVLEERGGYPVSDGAVAGLLAKAAELRLERALTRDPAKLDRLRLGDPERGGRGVLLQVQDERGAFLADLVLGYEPQGVYVRQRGAVQAWFTRGRLPDLSTPAMWIARPDVLASEQFVRLDVQPRVGPGYSLVRNAAGQTVMGPPFQVRRILDRVAAQSIWQTVQTFAPVDVAGAAAAAGPLLGRVLATTADGLVLRIELRALEAGSWLMISAAAGEEPSPEAQARAGAINQAFGPWAFRLTPAATEAVLPALAALTEPPAPESVPGPP